MRRRCPARRMLSASLVSISEVQLGSKLSSQEISSSSMVAALTLITSISDAAGEGNRVLVLKKFSVSQVSNLATFFLEETEKSSRLTGEVIKELTPEVKVLRALRQEPKQRQKNYFTILPPSFWFCATLGWCWLNQPLVDAPHH